jgi:DNA repair protein RadC
MTKQKVRSLKSAYSRLFQSIGAEVRVLTVREEEPKQRPSRIDSPEAAIAYWRRHVARAPWFDPGREMAVVICCNTKYVAVAFALVSIGTVNEALVHPRDIFRPAIALNAFAVVLMHNHPSGEAKPSKNDEALTNQIRQAGNILQIKLLDHVIVGEGKQGFSFNCGRISAAASR